MNASKQFRIWGIGLLTFILLLYILSDVLTPFVAGMAVAYFVDPLADRLEEWGLSRLVATSVITVCFFILTIGVLSTLLPVLATQVIGFASRVPEYMDYVRNLAEPLIKDIFAGVSESDLKELGSTIASFAKQGLGVLGQVLKQVISGGVALVDIVSILVLTPLVTFYLLRDWDVMVARIDNWLPRKHADIIRDQFRLVDQTLAGFVRGQASVCLILGVFYAAGLSVLGLEFGLLVGLGAGLISFIPYFGSILGLGFRLQLPWSSLTAGWTLRWLVVSLRLGKSLKGTF